MTDPVEALDVGAAFVRSREKYDELVTMLSSAPTEGMTHSEVEKLIEREGNELMRRLFQDHFDLRATRETVVRSIVGSDGIERTHRRRLVRQLETIFGTVGVSRMQYGADGTSSLRPLDMELNLPPDLFSFGVRKYVAEEVATSSFETLVEKMAKAPGAKVGRRQAQELALKAAQDFDAFYEGRSDPAVAGSLALSGRGSILVITADAKGLVVRPEDLREATRKAAERQSHKLTKRLSKGEKRNRKRMATVASVYTIGQFVRRPDDILDDLRREKKAEKRPRPFKKRVWASVAKSSEAVIREAFVEALARDPERKKTWVALVDGNADQIRVLERLAKEYEVELTIVLDIIHVIEYVWKAAYVFHKDGTQEAQDWVSERIRGILEGKAGHMAAGMRRSATWKGLAEAERAAVDECATYILNHTAYMRYDEYLAAGAPIATGVIEGACRHLVKDRMDITGARWSLDGADAVLQLRALWASGDFDDYWAFHEAQERERNHAALFALPITPPVGHQEAADAREVGSCA